MGWERTGTEDAPVWVLEFPHRPGLEVRCTVPSLRARVLAARIAPVLSTRADRDGRALLALAEVFAEDSLLGWNLTWGGRARSADAAGIGRVDLVLVAEILANWIELWSPTPEPEVNWSELDEFALDVEPAEEPPAEVEGEPAEVELVVTGG